MNPHFWWYVARAAGLTSWALLALAVVSGLARSGRVTHRPRPVWVQDLHRFLGGLAVVFVGVHMAALTLDRTVGFGLSALLVPFASTWRPGAVAWGVAALYLLLAVELTSLVMRHLPRRLWRAVHMSSLVLYGAGTVHLLTAGTDRSATPVRWAVLVVTATVVGLATFRALTRGAGPSARRGRAGAEGVEDGGELRRQRRLVAAGLPRGGVREGEPGRVQERPVHPDRGAGAAVAAVADDRVTDRRQVDPYLVRAAALQRHVEERHHRPGEEAAHLVAGPRRAAVVADGHPGPP